MQHLSEDGFLTIFVGIVPVFQQQIFLVNDFINDFTMIQFLKFDILKLNIIFFENVFLEIRLDYKK